MFGNQSIEIEESHNFDTKAVDLFLMRRICLTIFTVYKNKNPAYSWVLISLKTNYLFITYMVTSKPKRISVAAGVVHIIILLWFKRININAFV
jgi:hypothetical protein